MEYTPKHIQFDTCCILPLTHGCEFELSGTFKKVIHVDQSINKVREEMRKCSALGRGVVYLTDGTLDYDVEYLGVNKWLMLDDHGDTYEFLFTPEVSP